MKKKNKIIIQGARENNLKNINLEIPRDQFVRSEEHTSELQSLRRISGGGFGL